MNCKLNSIHLISLLGSDDDPACEAQLLYNSIVSLIHLGTNVGIFSHNYSRPKRLTVLNDTY